MVIRMEKYKILTRFWEQAKGLMGQSLSTDFMYVFWFQSKAKNIVHTWFMSNTIDIIFIDENINVVELMSSVKPWRLILPTKEYMGMIEVPAGYIEKNNITKSKYELDVKSVLGKITRITLYKEEE